MIDDPGAERALVGALMLHPDRIPEALSVVIPGDCYDQSCHAAFAALVTLWESGESHPDTIAVQRVAGVDLGWLVCALADASPAWRTHATTVAECRLARDLIGFATEVRMAIDAGKPPAVVADEARASLARIALPSTAIPDDLDLLDDLAESTVEEATWVVPGLIRSGWRVVIVGLEGMGKSFLAAQIAQAAAAGLHPFTRRPVRAVPVLLVDLENPLDAIVSRSKVVRDRVVGDRTWDRSGAWVLRRPGGIDLRSRRDIAELSAVLDAVRPELVCLGPLYKSYRRQGRESEEEAVLGVQQALDDLRTRFGFALLLEHHAPHGEQHNRQMRPIGSSAWLRWPEFGIGMDLLDDRSGPTFRLSRWRGDRVDADWPAAIQRTGRPEMLPFVAVDP